jgi:transposase
MTLSIVSLPMKRDGRTLDHKTLEEIRWMAVQRVREGEQPSDVNEAYGFHRTTIYKWLRKALRPGGGLRMLRSTPATGRPRNLTAKQEQQVFRWVRCILVLHL